MTSSLGTENNRCPMCGAELGFAGTRCMACGESLIDEEQEEGGYEDYAALSARRIAKIDGFFIALVGLLVLVMGLFGLWMFFTGQNEEMLPLMIGASLAGACWLTGGISYWIGNASGYWLIQPVNLFLVCWQLLHLEKFNIALMALPVIFALLTQHARRKLRETGG